MNTWIKKKKRIRGWTTRQLSCVYHTIIRAINVMSVICEVFNLQYLVHLTFFPALGVFNTKNRQVATRVHHENNTVQPTQTSITKWDNSDKTCSYLIAKSQTLNHTRVSFTVDFKLSNIFSFSFFFQSFYQISWISQNLNYWFSSMMRLSL